MGRARQERSLTPRTASALVALAVACSRSPTSPIGAAVSTGAPEPRIAFTDVTHAAGIDAVSWSGRPSKDHLLDSSGTGAAWIDFDQDGRLDLYVLSGWKLDGATIVSRGRNTLYRNRGDGTFEDVTERAHVGGEGEWACGVTVGDYDGDGCPDLFVTAFGRCLLYHNLRDGTFENVAAKLGVECPGWNTGACFFDADGDGRLDLFVAGYIQCSLDDVLKAERTLDWKRVDKVAVGPFGLAGAPDHFFLNDGNGFRDATVASGLEDRALAFGFSVRAFDYDHDGDLDLYVANDSDANELFRNDGSGHFEDVALWSGCALSRDGLAQAGMGVTAGDANGDGWLDLFVTNFSEDYSTLYLADAKGIFRDATVECGLKALTYWPLSWGASFADLDCDGDLDLVVVNGHIYPQVDAHPEFRMSFAQRPLLLLNDGRAKFSDASSRAGADFAAPRAGRTVIVGDYDNDGDLDLLFTNLDAPPTLLRNDSQHGSWLIVDCRVPPGRVSLIGTRIEVTANGATQVRDVSSSDSYVSCSDPRAHFGLGSATEAARVRVLWRDGTETVLEHVGANRILRVDQPR